MILTIPAIQARCNDDGDCLVWSGGVNSQGYPTTFIGRYNVTLTRLVGALKAGIPLDELKDAKHFRAWPTCGNPRCLADEHIRHGNVHQHRGFLRSAGRSSRSPAGAAALIAARRLAPNIKLSMEKAREIRAARTAGETRDKVAERYGINKDMVTRITQNECWAEAPNGASVFNWRPNA